jgi:hypothetical protein
MLVQRGSCSAERATTSRLHCVGPAPKATFHSCRCAMLGTMCIATVYGLRQLGTARAVFLGHQWVPRYQVVFCTMLLHVLLCHM